MKSESEPEVAANNLATIWPATVTGSASSSVSYTSTSGREAEKRELHFLPEVHGRLALKVNVSQRASVRMAVPSAMAERPHHQRAAIVRSRFFDLLIDRHGPIEVFGVKPAGHVQHRMGDVLQMRKRILLPPEFVVIRMLHVVVPLGHAAVQVARIHVGERTQRQKEAVAVRCARVERLAIRLRRAL